MGVIAKYKFNQNVYADFIPVFNSTFTSYTITDEIDADGFTIRTIESDSLPVTMIFGSFDSSGSGDYTKQYSLLEILEINTSNVTSMSQMFHRCKDLTYINTNFNTSKVINMSDMFSYCSSLTSLNVSNFNTNQVTNMNGMFYGCSSLTSLDLSNFNTNSVTNMSAMFRKCTSLTSLDLSNFNTNSVTNMNGMFQECSSLTSLDVSNFKTENVTDMRNLFKNCKSLTSIDVSNWNTNNVKYMYGMFSTCSSLTYLDLSSFNTKKVIDSGANTSMSTMFEYCSSLEVLDLSNFDTSGIEHNQNLVGQYMFYGNSKLMHISFIYASVETINCFQNSFNHLPKGTKIYYQDADLSNLISNNNIVYEEYKMNILESDEEINLRRIGDVYDELNLETGELTQRISNEEIIIDNNTTIINYGTHQKNSELCCIVFRISISNSMAGNYNFDTCLAEGFNTYYGFKHLTDNDWGEGVAINGNSIIVLIKINKFSSFDENGIKIYFEKNPLKIFCYKLATPVIKTINLKGKPSIDWQGDTYLHLENNTLYPQLDCEIESINYYEIPKLKANTLYTLRYVGEPTQCIFGGLTYETENNMILTSGSSDNLLYFDKEVRKVVLIEGDVRDRNFDYFEGIESLGAVEIVTHKTNMPIFAKGGRK